MDFRRARGPEQKQMRVQQILDAAGALYEEIGYDKVSFVGIVKKLNFARNSIYNYFSCKEDIYLAVLLQEIERFVADAQSIFTEECQDNDRFCEDWANLWSRHARMMGLFSIVNTIILKDATEEAHKQYRSNLHRIYWSLADTIRIIFPHFSDKDVQLFLEYQNYALAIFPTSIEFKKFNRIPIYDDAIYAPHTFPDEYIPYLKIILEHIQRNSVNK